MKKMRTHLVLALIVLFAGSSFSLQAQRVSVSFQMFYNELQPYGSWFNHPDYGYVWAPDVDGDFTPYSTNGYWTVTQYGNTWVSNYDWGWAPFHYGRWYYDDYYGWIWVPDTVWAPAWVVWRNGGGYYGWAPLSPGLNFSFSFGIFSRIPNYYWTFCPQQYVWSSSWYSYCAPRQRNVYIMNNTTYVNNYYVDNSNHYYSGPSHHEISRVTNRTVHLRQLEDCDRPSGNHVDRDKVIVYRPVVSRGNSDKPRFEHKPNGNSGNHSGWSRGNDNGNNNPRDNGNNGGNSGGNGNGNGGSNSGDDNGNGGNPRGNDGHGNGDQDAPGNSGGHNNGENSDNSGQGNSGNGNGGNDGQGNGNNPRGEEERRGGSNSRTLTYNLETVNHPSTNRNSNWSDNPGIENGRSQSTTRTFSQRSGNSSGNTSMNIPSRSGNSRNGSSWSVPSRSSSRGSSTFRSPSHSGGSRSFSTPSHSSGSRGSSGFSSPSRSGGSRSTPSFSSPSRSGGSKSFSPRKK